MARPRKFSKGPQVTSIGALAQGIAERRWFYWAHKVQHPSWLGSMPLTVLIGGVRNGLIFEALPNNEGEVSNG